MQFIKELNKRNIAKNILLIVSIPIIIKVLYFINILGIVFGSYLREISNCI